MFLISDEHTLDSEIQRNNIINRNVREKPSTVNFPQVDGTTSKIAADLKFNNEVPEKLTRSFRSNSIRNILKDESMLEAKAKMFSRIDVLN